MIARIENVKLAWKSDLNMKFSKGVQHENY